MEKRESGLTIWDKAEKNLDPEDKKKVKHWLMNALKKEKWKIDKGIGSKKTKERNWNFN